MLGVALAILAVPRAARERQTLARRQLDDALAQRPDPQLGAGQVLQDRHRAPGPPRRVAHPPHRLGVLLERAVRVVQPRDVHPRVDHREQGLRLARGGADGGDDLRAAHGCTVAAGGDSPVPVSESSDPPSRPVPPRGRPRAHTSSFEQGRPFAYEGPCARRVEFVLVGPLSWRPGAHVVAPGAAPTAPCTSGKCSAQCSRSASRTHARSAGVATRKRSSSSRWRSSGAPAIVHRTARRSNSSSTALCQESSRVLAAREDSPASASAYFSRVAGVIEPRSVSTLPSASVYSLAGAFSRSGRLGLRRVILRTHSLAVEGQARQGRSERSVLGTRAIEDAASRRHSTVRERRPRVPAGCGHRPSAGFAWPGHAAAGSSAASLRMLARACSVS